MLKKISRLANTLQFLKPIQIYWRIWLRIYRPKLNLSIDNIFLRPIQQVFTAPLKKIPSFNVPNIFTFLNETHLLTSKSDWNHPEWEKLWLYNLHYFDDLNALDAKNKYQQHQQLIQRWINENPPCQGNGWEAYPLSLRIVNWIKWAKQGNTLQLQQQHSLLLQVRCLRQQLEYHLLGNHLFTNAKALVFAGLYFTGEEADTFLDKGLEILAEQLPEQILADGGHFELSPMYHCIIFEDLLDLINISRCYNNIIKASQITYWQQLATQMGTWLQTMVHPDGDIALFNDAAFKIAAQPKDLFAYMDRLSISTVSNISKTQLLAASGYARLENQSAVLLADVGKIGPDYLPGHAHADTLSFELSLFGQRIIVDSGTSCYGYSAERLRQRTTAAHNTVEINQHSSSEVWGGFRVAKRAYPFSVILRENENFSQLRAAHNGYQRLDKSIIHYRTWCLEAKQLIIKDWVTGKFKNATGRLLFPPELIITPSKQANTWNILFNKKQLAILIINTSAKQVKHSYHPEFGLSYQTSCIEYYINNNQVVKSLFKWND